jgi:DNA-binding response OmpR family regulator
MPAQVLLIDDSEMTIALLTQALATHGVEAHSATDLATLDSHLSKRAYDLIVVDVNMPEMYGDDVVEFLRVQRQLKSKLILYSDTPEQELRARAERVGANGFIAKANGLEASVESILNALRSGGTDVPQKQKAARKVLVVDDSEATGSLLKAELSAQGHEVSTAISADAATKIILKKKTRPDLVLLDVNMPGVSGEEFCRFIKGNSLFESIQVIFCSGEDEQRLQSLVKSCGADGYLRKDALIAKEILELLSEP